MGRSKGSTQGADMGFGRGGDMRSQLRFSMLLLLLLMAAGVHFVQAARSLLRSELCQVSDISATWKETGSSTIGNIIRYTYEIQVTNNCKSCDAENVSLKVSFNSASASSDTVYVKPIPAGAQVSFEYRTTLYQDAKVTGVVASDASFVTCQTGRA